MCWGFGGTLWGFYCLFWFSPKKMLSTSPKALSINTNIQGTVGGKCECC